MSMTASSITFVRLQRQPSPYIWRIVAPVKNKEAFPFSGKASLFSITSRNYVNGIMTIMLRTRRRANPRERLL